MEAFERSYPIDVFMAVGSIVTAIEVVQLPPQKNT